MAGLFITLFTLQPASLWAQSGRGRPRVNPPSAATAPPVPVTIPADAAAVKQEQNGFVSRMVLRNGITVVIDEQHSLPIAAAVACVRTNDKTPDSRLISALVQRIVLRGTNSRPAGRALADIRALGGRLDAFTASDASVFAAVAPSNKLKETLAVQSDLIKDALFAPEDVRSELQLASDEVKALGVLNTDEPGLAQADVDSPDYDRFIAADPTAIDSMT